MEATAADLVVDTTRQYKANAGQCEKCGHFKTWEFKFVNPKTGKGMPGHVTKEGFKIGDGSCPYWSNVEKMNAARVEKKATAPKPQPPGTWIKEITASTATPGAPRESTTPAASRAGSPPVVIMIGTMRVELAPVEAIRVAKEILDQVVS